MSFSFMPGIVEFRWRFDIVFVQVLWEASLSAGKDGTVRGGQVTAQVFNRRLRDDSRIHDFSLPSAGGFVSWCFSGLGYGDLVFAGFAALVFDKNFSFDGVAFQVHWADLFLQADAGVLPARCNLPGVPNAVVLQNDVPGFPADANAGYLLVPAVVFDEIVLQPITMPGHAYRFVAEQDPILCVVPNLVVAEQIVGVLVANRNAVAPIASSTLSSNKPCRTRQHRNSPSVPLLRAAHLRMMARCEPLPG